MQPGISDLIKRIGLAVVGQALPETSALNEIVRDVQRGLLATVITGVLASFLVLLGGFGFYRFLLSEGLSDLTALSLSAGLLFLLTVIGALISNKYISKASQAKEKLKPFSGSSLEKNTYLEPLFQAFLEGFLKKETSVEKQSARTTYPTDEPAQPVEIQKSLHVVKSVGSTQL